MSELNERYELIETKGYAIMCDFGQCESASSVKSKEFVSKIEEIKPAKELNFDATPGFGDFKVFFPEEAVAHPAKMNTRLLEYLVIHYTKKGDVVLDPMAGTGSTGVVAALHGRNAICIELEEKFVKWAEKAKAMIDRAPTINQKGQLKIIHGDARKLSELLGRVDEVITSPPYTNEPAENPNVRRIRKGGEFPIEEGITYSKENISNLPHADVDEIITSPPYESSLEGSTRHTRGGIASRDPAMAQTGTYATTLSSGVPVGYSPNSNNIGNMKKETYLEAMSQVYRQMYSVLKSGGKAVIVIKPFVRHKSVIDLPYQTLLLLEKIGFKLTDVLKLKLEMMSFWRILYYRKHTEVPVIAHEYILVVEKL